MADIIPELNKANRETCDVDIRILKTLAPFLNFKTANVTTAGLSSDAVYAMAKGSRRIAFPNPMTGTMTIEAQVYPFKFFALLTNGSIDTEAVVAGMQTVTASETGSLELTLPESQEIVKGSVFVYPEDAYGEDASVIKGTFEGKKFTATENEKIVAQSAYTVAYLVKRKSGVKKISFTNKNLPRDYFITMQTVDKDEEGNLIPFLITAYKASIQRSFELSFSSEGDPATVTMTFDLMEDKNGNILDIVELTEDVSGE